eukprot:s2501_g4.t1
MAIEFKSRTIPHIFEHIGFRSNQANLPSTRVSVHLEVKLYKGGPYKLQLWKPGDLVTKFDEIRPKEKTPEQIEEEVIAEVDVIWNKDPARRLTENPCISPELVGGGNTTLYTSNRAAWFDPELGAGKFRPDHVANYVELSLASLTFQPSEKQPALDLTYYVRASVCGISVSSSALHRAKPAWSQVLPYHLVDPNMIRFEGQRLLVPLPAGCWAEAERRKVKIEVGVGRVGFTVVGPYSLRSRSEKGEPKTAAPRAAVSLRSEAARFSHRGFECAASREGLPVGSNHLHMNRTEIHNQESSQISNTLNINQSQSSQVLVNAHDPAIIHLVEELAEARHREAFAHTESKVKLMVSEMNHRFQAEEQAASDRMHQMMMLAG